MAFEGRELQWYSVWSQQEMEFEGRPIRFDVDPPPPVALLLCVSEAAAAVVERELFKLCAKHKHIAGAGKKAPRSTGTLIVPGAGLILPRCLFSTCREVQPLHPAHPLRFPAWD